MIELGSLTQTLTRVRRRLRWQRALESFTGTGVGVLTVVAVALLAERLGQLGWLASIVSLCMAALVLAAALGALWPVHARRAAWRIDQSHALHDRVQSALEFAHCDAPTPFMQAAVRDALERSASISPRRAAPFHAPRALRYALPAMLALGVAGLVPLPAPEGAGRRGPQTALAVVAPLDAETTEALAADARALVTPHSEETRDWVERYEAILVQLSSGALTREQALQALEALQRRIEASRKGESAALSEGLRRLAQALSAERVTGALARALERGDLDAAASALEELSRRLSKAAMPRAEREELRRALKRVAERREQAGPREPELLKKDRARSPASSPEPQLLKRKRELSRLDRETSQAAREESKRKLEQLRRTLGEAATRDAAGAGEALGDAAQQTRDLAQRQRDRQQQRRLSEQLEQLRQELQRQQRMQRRQNPGSPQSGQGDGNQAASDPQGQAQRMQHFRLRARGQKDSPASADENRMPLVMKKPDRPPTDAGQAEAGQAGGAGANGDAVQALALGGDGPAASTLQLPGGAEERVSSQQSDESDFSGQSRDPRLRGQTQDSQVEGVAGRGPSRSEVIVGAADTGFATTPYRDVYTDYREHAEDVLDRDEIPPGYRFYVRRYFQLIRPRQEGNAP